MDSLAWSVCLSVLVSGGLTFLIYGKIPILWGGVVRGTPARVIGILLIVPVLLTWLALSLGSGIRTAIGLIIILYIFLFPAAAWFYGSTKAAQQRKVCPPSVFTVDEIASRFNLTQDTVLELIHSGKLEAKKIGEEYRITSDSVNKYLILSASLNRLNK